MHEFRELLELSKQIARQAGQELLASSSKFLNTYTHSIDHPKEIKSIADRFLEEDILKEIRQIGLPILSEESGYIHAPTESNYCFIIDPLDGTFNYVKGLGPSAISIALWRDNKPVFGVIYNLSDQKLSWGGCEISAYCEDQPISVSTTTVIARASICSGFPVRFDSASDIEALKYLRTIRSFAKVRMLGSAAISLLHVANGSADAYSEKHIMLWDVAAGLAIVEGAGGRYSLKETGSDWCYDVSASNAILLDEQTGF